MATTNVTMRIDEDLKAQLQELLENIGMDMTTFFVMTAKQTIRGLGLPFQPTLEVPDCHRINNSLYEIRKSLHEDNEFVKVD